MSELALQRIAENKSLRSTTLDLRYCDIEQLPSVLSECGWLEELLLGDNRRLSNISLIAKLKNLQKFYAPYTQVSDLLPLKDLQNLQILNVHDSQVFDLSFLSNLHNLQQLDVSSTHISDLLPLEKLNRLRELTISSTHVLDLSPLKGLLNLKTIYVSYTQISDLSPLYALHNLQKLDASYSQITDLSPLKELQNLQEISISSTRVSNLLPLKDLKNLKKIYISSTQVSDLSPLLPIIKKEKQVKWSRWGGDINVENCPLTIPPPQIVKQGNTSIFRYFEQLEKEGIDYIFEAKLLLIGEGGAGKTSLCRKLFNPSVSLPKEEESTQGIDIQPLYFDMPDGKQFRLNIWDFAGQGKYQSAHSFFYTHRSLYILVDDTRTLNEDEAYRTYYNFWLQTAELFGGDSPLLVLHNQKADRTRTGFNFGSFQATFPFVKELFCINLGGDDTEGILDLKKQIERWAQKLPHIGDVVPKTWARVREDIEKERQRRPYISDERYREICAAHGITDEAKQSDLSRYFHDLGVFLHFQENPLLRRDVFLQNEWVTNAVYKILDDLEIAVKKRGRFDKGDLARLWNEGYYAKRRDELLALMLQFELCYQVQDTEIFVAPQLLPGDLPKYDLGTDIPLQLKYEYGFMPKGLLYRLIVRLHRHISQGQSAVWNGGVVLEHAGARADILESLDRRQISVRATGVRAKELVTIINEEVEKLHDTYGERLKVEAKIPCNCDTCRKSNSPHFYDKKKDLEFRLGKGKKTIECGVSFDDVNVQGLLDGVFTQVLDIEAVTASHRLNTTHIREFIEEGETKKALEIFKKINPDKAAVLLGKLAELNKQYPTLAGDEYLREKSKIDAGLLALLDV